MKRVIVLMLIVAFVSVGVFSTTMEAQAQSQFVDSQTVILELNAKDALTFKIGAKESWGQDRPDWGLKQIIHYFSEDHNLTASEGFRKKFTKRGGKALLEKIKSVRVYGRLHLKDGTIDESFLSWPEGGKGHDLIMIKAGVWQVELKLPFDNVEAVEYNFNINNKEKLWTSDVNATLLDDISANSFIENDN